MSLVSVLGQVPTTVHTLLGIVSDVAASDVAKTLVPVTLTLATLATLGTLAGWPWPCWL